MLQQVGVLIVSFLITNWVYSEILLFLPSIEPYTQKIVRVARIPTHNEWPEIADSREAAKLSSQVHDFLGVSAFRVKGFSGNKVSRREKAHLRELPYIDLFQPAQGAQSYKSNPRFFMPPGDLYLLLFDYISL